MQYLLDANILSDLVRNPSGAVTNGIRHVGEENVCTSVIVSAELRSGARKKGSDKLTAQLEKILGSLPVLPFESPADVMYADLRARLERSGRSIGANDLLIGAHALTANCTLVTDNDREFSRIEGLKRENWLC